MKLTRLLSGLSVGLVLLVGTGCRNNTIILPTDEEARERARIDPGPPSVFGGAGPAPALPPGVRKDSPFAPKGLPGDATNPAPGTKSGGGAGEKK